MKRLLFVGASGYGNVGDDSYRVVFEAAFSGHELRFANSTPDERRVRELVRWADAVVMGGGGIVYNNDTAHFAYMRMYMDAALELGKPLAFSSVGVQLVPPVPSSASNAVARASEIACWRRYLERAALITVRNPLDAEIMGKISGATISAYPDACYRFPGADSATQRTIAIVVPTKSSLGKHRPSFTKFISAHRPIIISMSRDDDGVASDLGQRHGLQTMLRAKPRRVVSYFGMARKLLTGRYHGHVLGRASGIDAISIVDDRYKSAFEPRWSDLVEARQHTQKLRAVLGLEPPKQAPMLHMAWLLDDWNRNREHFLVAWRDAGFPVVLWHRGQLACAPVDGIELRDARDIIERSPIERSFEYEANFGSHAPAADLFRYEVLSELGGGWSDLDVLPRAAVPGMLGRDEPLFEYDRVIGKVEIRFIAVRARHELLERLRDVAVANTEAWIEAGGYESEGDMARILDRTGPHMASRELQRWAARRGADWHRHTLDTAIDAETRENHSERYNKKWPSIQAKIRKDPMRGLRILLGHPPTEAEDSD